MESTHTTLVALFLTCSGLCCAQPPTPPPLPPVHTAAYPWLSSSKGASTPQIAPLSALYREPPGCRRIDSDEGRFGAWLRGLPVLTDRDLVHDYRGRPIPSAADSVILLDVGARDLQQCADTLIRLHAEYLWAGGQAAKAAYHYTSGDLSSWADWKAGIRFDISGSRVNRRPGPARPGDHDSYRAWLQGLFIYAGTMSLHLDSTPVAAAERLQGGDFFVDPGSPGHAVMILDVVEAEDGARYGLIGQGYTPAQELHVLGSPSALDGVWFELPSGPAESLSVPSWSPFPRSSARRFSLRGRE